MTYNSINGNNYPEVGKPLFLKVEGRETSGFYKGKCLFQDDNGTVYSPLRWTIEWLYKDDAQS